MIKALALILACTACGYAQKKVDDTVNKYTSTDRPRVVLDFPVVGSDTRMKEFVTEFYADAEVYGNKVEHDVTSVDFINNLPVEDGFPPDTIGFCKTFVNPSDDSEVYRAVSILQPAWDAMTWQSQRTLIYHELGHCALNEVHTPAGSGQIMDPYLVPDTISQPSWPDLVNYEFNNSHL